MRKVISIFLSLTLMLNVTMPVMASGFSEQDLLVIDFLEELDVFEQTLNKYDLTINDLEVITERDGQYYDDLLKHLKESEVLGDIVNEHLNPTSSSAITLRSSSNPPISTPPPTQESTDFAKRLIFAKNMAYQNSLVDRNARSLEEDTAYMYIANYIDIRSPGSNVAYDHFGDGKNQPFPFYLTNYCRDCYDLYLSKSNGLDKIFGSVDLVLDLYNTGTSVTGLTDGLKNAGSLFDVAGAGYAGSDLKEEFTKFTNIIKASDEPLLAVQQLENKFYAGEETEDGVRKFVDYVNIARGGATGIATAVGFEVFAMVKDFYEGLLHHANWLSLRRTTNFRITERMFRYLGW